jgi:hypothetical protein
VQVQGRTAQGRLHGWALSTVACSRACMGQAAGAHAAQRAGAAGLRCSGRRVVCRCRGGSASGRAQAAWDWDSGSQEGETAARHGETETDSILGFLLKRINGPSPSRVWTRTSAGVRLRAAVPWPWSCEIILGLFMPVNGPFRVCLNGPGSCPPVGLGVGPSTARCIVPGRPGPK